LSLIIGLPLSEAAGAAGRQVNSQPDFSQIFLGDDFLENDGHGRRKKRTEIIA
jgi:hypothetical protein